MSRKKAPDATETPRKLREALLRRGHRLPDSQNLYLCEFYLNNTIPFLEIVSEQDKLAGERKLVELLVNKYNGKARHSDLMNMSHMKKREFKECVESLMERAALTVDSYTGLSN